MEKNIIKKRKSDIIKTLEKAQKIAFSPLSFQAIVSLIELGILKEIDIHPQTLNELLGKFSYSEYTIKTLLEVGLSAEIIECDDNNIYKTTKLGQVFLYDDMTRVNLNFVKDVCYSGAEKLTDSFLSGKPKGLNKIRKDAKTIYPYLSKLPEKIKQSWYEFDHYYSNNCFDLIYKIIFKNSNAPIYDIGGNTGIFERKCLELNPDTDITMIDLAENIDYIKDDEELKNCKFIKADILSETDKLPQMSGNILMSQFLDCFSPEQIIYILKKLYKNTKDNIKIYILEPFIDNQRYKGAQFSLVHTSLYFTCMANGCSKMYSKTEMENLIKESGFVINETYSSIGVNDYTLLECVKNV